MSILHMRNARRKNYFMKIAIINNWEVSNETEVKYREGELIQMK